MSQLTQYILILTQLLVISLALPKLVANACDPCGLHSSVQVPGVLSTLRTKGLVEGSLTLGAQQQLSRFKVVGENDLRTTESDLELIKNLSVTQLSLGYNISNQAALTATAPFIIRSYQRFERFKRVDEVESGFGDMALTGMYSPYSFNDVEGRLFIAALGGVKLPTGDSGSLERIASEDQTSADQRIQGRGLTLGTGSVDFPLGVVSYGRSGRLIGFASAQYTIRSEGSADYRFANDLIWSVAPGYLFVVGEEESISLSAVLSGEQKGDDRLNGAGLSRTSANNLYLGPEVFYSVSERASLQAALDMPIYVDVGGATVKPELRARLSIGISF
jgi:hypothetical protein